MALINCPECGHQTSDQAGACPSCAYPLGGGQSSRRGAGTANQENVKLKAALSIVARVVVGSFIFVAGADGVADAAIIGGALICLSSIPTAVRARTEWLRAGEGTSGDQQIEQRLTEMDQHYQDQMDNLEHRHQEQVQELEERLDFTERLLARGKSTPP